MVGGILRRISIYHHLQPFTLKLMVLPNALTRLWKPASESQLTQKLVGRLTVGGNGN